MRTTSCSPSIPVLAAALAKSKQSSATWRILFAQLMIGSLAYAEMRLLLAKMLWHFDMELAHSQDNWFAKLQGFTIWNRSGLDIRLKSVKR